jgi:hypothetical protein
MRSIVHHGGLDSSVSQPNGNIIQQDLTHSFRCLIASSMPEVLTPFAVRPECVPAALPPSNLNASHMSPNQTAEIEQAPWPTIIQVGMITNGMLSQRILRTPSDVWLSVRCHKASRHLPCAPRISTGPHALSPMGLRVSCVALVLKSMLATLLGTS